MTDKMMTLCLPDNDVGQIIDALCVRRDAWRYTAGYLLEGHEEAGRVIEECSDGAEAAAIADYYDAILSRIAKQRKPHKHPGLTGSIPQL